MQELFKIVIKNPHKLFWPRPVSLPVFHGKKQVGHAMVQSSKKELVADLWLTVATDFTNHVFTLVEKNSFYVVKVKKSKKGFYQRPTETFLPKARTYLLTHSL